MIRLAFKNSQSPRCGLLLWQYVLLSNILLHGRRPTLVTWDTRDWIVRNDTKNSESHAERIAE